MGEHRVAGVVFGGNFPGVDPIVWRKLLKGSRPPWGKRGWGKFPRGSSPRGGRPRRLMGCRVNTHVRF